MRLLPFLKPSNKVNTCGVGFDGGGGSYTLLPATSSTLGGVIIGEGVSVDEDGTISVDGGSGVGGFDFSASEVLVGTYFNQNLYKKSYQIASDITCSDGIWTNIITDSALNNAEIITSEPLKLKSAFLGTSQLANNCMLRLANGTITVLAVGMDIPLLTNSVVTIYYIKNS